MFIDKKYKRPFIYMSYIIFLPISGSQSKGAWIIVNINKQLIRVVIHKSVSEVEPVLCL